MRHRAYVLIALAVLIVSSAGGCRRLGAKFGVTWAPFTTVTGEQAVDATITKLNVEIWVGEVRVVAGEAGAVRVEADVKIKESLANPDADRGTFADHVRISTDGDTLTVADAHTGQPDEKNWRVSLVVHVPAHLTVNLRTGAGRVVVDGMTSDIKATTGAGKIIIRSTTPGAITADTGAGKIEITVDGVTGPVTASAGAGQVSLSVARTPPTKDVVLTVGVGDVMLTLPPGAPGTFELKADVGRVSVTGHDGIEVQRVAVGATGKGKIGDGVPTYKLETATGSVRVR